MSVSINNVSNINTQQKIAFNGKWDKTEQGNPYYKTNSGMVAGGVMAVPAAMAHLMNFSLPTTEEGVKKECSEITDVFTKELKGKDKNKLSDNLTKAFYPEGFAERAKRNKTIKKLVIPFALIAAGATIGCGLLVDKKRNEKAKEAADLTKQVGTKNAILQGEGLALSNKGRVYYDSNVGAKNGALLGAACGVAHTLMVSVGKLNIGGLISNALLFALGGWIMGKIADSNTNKDAVRNS